MHTVESVHSMPQLWSIPVSPCKYNVCIGQAEDKEFFRKRSRLSHTGGGTHAQEHELTAIHTPHENTGMITNHKHSVLLCKA